MQGHNKDVHPGNPQVVFASVCTPGGFVLLHACYPGNSSAFAVAHDLMGNLPKLDENEERMWVSDGRMLGRELMAQLNEAG